MIHGHNSFPHGSPYSQDSQELPVTPSESLEGSAVNHITVVLPEKYPRLELHDETKYIPLNHQLRQARKCANVRYSANSISSPYLIRDNDSCIRRTNVTLITRRNSSTFACT